MKIINYPWRILFLSLSITLAPGQQLSATIKQFTDEKGTIHINNSSEDTNKLPKKDYNPPAQPQKSEVVKPPERTPSNIFPAPEAADKEEAEPPDDDD